MEDEATYWTENEALMKPHEMSALERMGYWVYHCKKCKSPFATRDEKSVIFCPHCGYSEEFGAFKPRAGELIDEDRDVILKRLERRKDVQVSDFLFGKIVFFFNKMKVNDQQK